MPTELPVEVILTTKKGHVAIGRIRPVDLCHGTRIAAGQVVVEVVHAIIPSAELPIPCEGADNIGEAVGAIIIWPRSDALTISAGNVEKNPSAMAPGRAAQPPAVSLAGDPGSIPGAMAPGSQSVSSGWSTSQSINGAPSGNANKKQFFDRKSLLHKPCQLLHSCNGSIFCHGLVSFCDPSDCVSDRRLGEKFVGVSITDIGKESGTNSVRCKACIHEAEVHGLCIWEVEHVVVNGHSVTEHLGLSENMTTDDLFISEEDVIMRSKKRSYNFIRRIPGVSPSQGRNAKILASTEISLFIGSVCCLDRCCSKFSHDEVFRTRSRMMNMKCCQRKVFVLDGLGSTFERGKVTRIMFSGQEICLKAWWMLIGLSQGTFYNYRRDFRKGHCNAEHGNFGKIRPKKHTLAAQEIFTSFVGENAETMPHKSRRMEDGSRENVRKLPSMLTKSSILKDLNVKVKKTTGKTMSKSSFCSHWRSDFSDVAISKHTGFSKCNECVVLKEMIAMTRDEAELRTLHIRMRVHMLAPAGANIGTGDCFRKKSQTRC